MKFVSSDLPRPNSAEEDSYGGGGVKKSAAGTSTTATRSRQLSSSSPATMEGSGDARSESSSKGSEVERGK